LVVDIDAFALQNAYEVNYQPDSEEVVGLLNIGASSMTINIVRGTEFLFTRDITTGGNQYTDFLQRELGATFEEAEQCKLEGGSVEVTGDQVASVLHSVSENLALEIEKTFDYFKTTTYSDNVSKLYVSGGASKTEGLKDYLAETFQFPVEYLNPFRRINPGVTGGMLDESEHSGVEFAISVGLALRTV
jgi:type IV pilus assembly protein PilM